VGEGTKQALEMAGGGGGRPRWRVKNERDEETCIIIPIVFIHKRKKEIIYIRFPYMKYRREISYMP
jgi:hypothetical protein